jgi:hypothetical protein
MRAGGLAVARAQSRLEYRGRRTSWPWNGDAWRRTHSRKLVRRHRVLAGSNQIPVLSLLAQQRQRHRPVLERIYGGIVECSAARKNLVAIRRHRLAIGSQCKRIENCVVSCGSKFRVLAVGGFANFWLPRLSLGNVDDPLRRIGRLQPARLHDNMFTHDTLPQNFQNVVRHSRSLRHSIESF